MKITRYFFALALMSTAAFAQVGPAAVLNSDVVLPSEQEPYQQLIGYALEITNATFEQAKPLGKYRCEDIFATDGYPALVNYPCQVIVHSDAGPIVVRYQNVNDETSALIDSFLTNNQLKDQIYYRKGRFRFAFENVDNTSDQQNSKAQK